MNQRHRIETKGRRAGKRPALDEGGQGTGFLIVFMFSFFIMGLMITMFRISDSDRRMGQAKKYDSIAIHAADSALEQTLSRIRGGEIKPAMELPSGTSPTPTPILILVPVGVDAYSTTACVRIDFAKSAAGSIIRDFEGNLQYDATSAVTNIRAVGSENQGQIRRGVKSRFSIINFGRYMSFTSEDDDKSITSFDGPYHCNGSVNMRNPCNWNVKFYKFNSARTPVPCCTPNPFYDPSYTTVASVSIMRGGSYDFWSTKGTTIVQASTSESSPFDRLPVPSRPEGTWIDGRNGGTSIAMPVIPFSDFNTMAQLVLRTNLVRDYRRYVVQGFGSGFGFQEIPLAAASGIIDVGVATGTCGYSVNEWPVKVNLNALNKGRASSSSSVGVFGQCLAGEGYLGESDTDAQTHYEQALNSEYGLVIFVDGNAAIWGRLPLTTAEVSANPTPYNTPSAGQTMVSKKVTIICTGDAQIIGDVLPSRSPYRTGSDSEVVSATPTINNPTNDAIAILSGGNIYVNPWYRGFASYFYNSSTGATGGDMRISAFLYAPNGVTGGANNTTCASGVARGNQPYKSPLPAGYFSNLQYFTFHGAIVVKSSGSLPGSSGYSRVYDPMLKINLSRIVPAGTIIVSWQEMLGFNDALFNIGFTPTPTP